MNNLTFHAQEFIAVSFSPFSAKYTICKDLLSFLKTRPGIQKNLLAASLAAAFLLILAGSRSAQAQTATVNWTNVHQVIDGFGASDEGEGESMSQADQAFFFGTGPGQLGLSLLRVGVTDGGQDPGDCTSVSQSCAGVYVSDMQAVIANGGRVFASPWSPPAAYKTNGSVICTDGSGNGALATGDYASYANWLANFVKSLQTEDGISLYAISIQNEPDQCQDYDSAVWSAANIDAFITSNLGPTFAADGLSPLIFMPEAGNYSATLSLGAACGTDESCMSYVAGYQWHDYSANLSGTNTVSANSYPSSWMAGKKYWETEASCLSGGFPTFCESGFVTNITDALEWAAVIDQRIAGDGANAWLWWLLQRDSGSGQVLEGGSTVTKRAYMLGQYSKFVRPGYYRIDATRSPQAGVSVSAYQNASANALAIIVTNYNSLAVSQTFNITNAPTFATMTPTVTDASQNLTAQPKVSVSSNSFTYTLPAQSITTFISSNSASAPAPPSNLSGTVVQ